MLLEKSKIVCGHAFINAFGYFAIFRVWILYI